MQVYYGHEAWSSPLECDLPQGSWGVDAAGGPRRGTGAQERGTAPSRRFVDETPLTEGGATKAAFYGFLASSS